jgi:hypothetical protein
MRCRRDYARRFHRFQKSLSIISPAWTAHANWCDYCGSDVFSHYAADWPCSLDAVGLSVPVDFSGVSPVVPELFSSCIVRGA